VGATVESGFELIADELDLATAVEESDLVVTGEGFLDEASFDGKVVGGLVALAEEFGVPILAVAGEVFDGVGDRVEAVSLVRSFGRERAMADTVACITEAVAAHLATR
jgi:glycerate kinase